VPTEIYAAVQYPTDLGRAAALGTVMMAVTILFALLQQRFVGRRRFDTVSGKGYRPRPIRLGRAGRAAAFGFELVYLAVSVALPITALILVSLSSLWTGIFQPARATLANFTYVLFSYSLTQTALGNSLFLAVTGATIGVGLGALQAYAVRSRQSRASRLIEPVLSLPLGVPGIIIGLGILILLIGTPLYSTIWILLIAYVAHFFPFALRSLSAMLLSLNPELEQSARASGATWLQTMRFIVLPLLKPALVATWLMLFVIFIRELGATILLYAQGTETISVALVVLGDRYFGYVAALAVTQVALLLGAFFLFGRFGASILER
jgi:iron(III) transport system permease protein